MKPIVIERTFNAAVSVVWNAITDKDQMKQWYFDLPDFKPVMGLEFQFWGGDEKSNTCISAKSRKLLNRRKFNIAGDTMENRVILLSPLNCSKRVPEQSFG